MVTYRSASTWFLMALFNAIVTRATVKEEKSLVCEDEWSEKVLQDWVFCFQFLSATINAYIQDDATVLGVYSACKNITVSNGIDVEVATVSGFEENEFLYIQSHNLGYGYVLTGHSSYAEDYIFYKDQVAPLSPRLTGKATDWELQKETMIMSYTSSHINERQKQKDYKIFDNFQGAYPRRDQWPTADTCSYLNITHDGKGEKDWYDLPCDQLLFNTSFPSRLMSGEYKVAMACRQAIKKDDCLLNNVTCPSNSACFNVHKVEFNLGYKCVCDIGFEAKIDRSKNDTAINPNCIEINECRSYPCKYNATCTDKFLDVNCDCLPDFTGKYCETFVICSKCSTHGKCVEDNETVSASCVCDQGYTGIHCNIQKAEQIVKEQSGYIIAAAVLILIVGIVITVLAVWHHRRMKNRVQPQRKGTAHEIEIQADDESAPTIQRRASRIEVIRKRVSSLGFRKKAETKSSGIKFNIPMIHRASEETGMSCGPDNEVDYETEPVDMGSLLGLPKDSSTSTENGLSVIEEEKRQETVVSMFGGSEHDLHQQENNEEQSEDNAEQSEEMAPDEKGPSLVSAIDITEERHDSNTELPPDRNPDNVEYSIPPGGIFAEEEEDNIRQDSEEFKYAESPTDW